MAINQFSSLGLHLLLLIPRVHGLLSGQGRFYFDAVALAGGSVTTPGALVLLGEGKKSLYFLRLRHFFFIFCVCGGGTPKDCATVRGWPVGSSRTTGLSDFGLLLLRGLGMRRRGRLGP